MSFVEAVPASNSRAAMVDDALARELALERVAGRRLGLRREVRVRPVSDIAALMERWDAAMSSRDAAAAAAMSPEDVEYVDHRALGWEPLRGRPAVEGWYRSFLDGVEALALHSEVLETRGDLVLLRQEGSFRAVAQDGGGEGEVVTITVVTMRDGRFARIEIYEDEAAARAAMAR